MSRFAAVAALHAGPPSPQPDALAEWIRSLGGFVGALEARCPPEGVRGLYAGADIAAGDVLLRVPRRCMLLPEDGGALLPTVRGIVGGMADHVLLALRLLRTADDPAWRPYHDALPAALPGHPLYWSAADLAWLDGSSLRRLVEDRRALLEDELRSLGAGGIVVDGDWQRARTLVSSRVFSGANREIPTLALVPYAELMNHSFASQVTWAFEAEGFVLRARVAIRSGEEVCDDYGKKSNGRLLLHYGFTMPDNPEAECVVYPWIYGPFRVRAGHDEGSAELFAALAGAPGLLEETCVAALERLRVDCGEGGVTENQRNALRVHRDERRVLEWLRGPGHDPAMRAPVKPTDS